MGFRVEVIESSVTLSAMNTVSYEFIEYVGDDGIVNDYSYEGDDVYGVKCL